MKKEYDFSKAEKGKFYHAEKDLEIPIYLDRNVGIFFRDAAHRKKTDVEKFVNKILKNEIAIHKEMGIRK